MGSSAIGAARWAPTHAIWLPILQNEQEVKLDRYFGPTTVGTMCPAIGRIGGDATWTSCFGSTATAPGSDKLRGSMSPACGLARSAPTSARSTSRSGSSEGLSSVLSAPCPPPLHRSIDIASREGHVGPSSVPPRVKKEPKVKEES
jgi:hypothetical protein